MALPRGSTVGKNGPGSIQEPLKNILMFYFIFTSRKHQEQQNKSNNGPETNPKNDPNKNPNMMRRAPQRDEMNDMEQTKTTKQQAK